VEEVAFRPCTAALDAAPSEVKRVAAGALARVEEGTPSLAVVMREYALGARGQAFAPYLGGLGGCRRGRELGAGDSRQGGGRTGGSRWRWAMRGTGSTGGCSRRWRPPACRCRSGRTGWT
jgi:hypothetical protein